MTNGTSQGLFVIVAVVIFGIFVLISYLLFRDNLKTGLGSIFEDSIEESLYNSNGEKRHFEDLKIVQTPYGKQRNNNLYFKLNKEELANTWKGTTEANTSIRFFSHELTDTIVIPWGQKIEITMDVLASDTIKFTYDYNSSVYPYPQGTIVNDVYNEQIVGEGSASYYKKTVPKNKKTTVTLGFTNGHTTRNPDKLPIQHSSTFLLFKNENTKLETLDLEITNIKYKINGGEV